MVADRVAIPSGTPPDLARKPSRIGGKPLAISRIGAPARRTRRSESLKGGATARPCGPPRGMRLWFRPSLGQPRATPPREGLAGPLGTLRKTGTILVSREILAKEKG